MRALIIGCGRVGATIALQLQREEWDVTVVDENEDALSRLGDHWPGAFLVGHGMDTALLREAGIEEADAVVAATDGDNTNIVIAQIAKRRFNVPKVIARILDPLRADWYERQGVHTICPTKVAIDMLEREVRAAAAEQAAGRDARAVEGRGSG